MKTIKEKTGRKSFLLKFLEENQRKTGRRRKPEENPEAKVESFKSTNSEGYRLALAELGERKTYRREQASSALQA